MREPPSHSSAHVRAGAAPPGWPACGPPGKSPPWAMANDGGGDGEGGEKTKHVQSSCQLVLWVVLSMFELEFAVGSANGCMDGGMEVERSWLMSSRRAASDSELAWPA